MAVSFNEPGSNSAVKSAKFLVANLLIASNHSGKCSERDSSGHFPILTNGLGCMNLLIFQTTVIPGLVWNVVV
jgi:hypothetical protein